MSIFTILGFVAAICTTSAFLPQVFQTLKTRDVSGISLPMYAIFTLGTTLWTVYGISVQDWPMIIANVITTSLAAVVLGLKITLGRQAKSQKATTPAAVAQA